ncbi:MAG TPA: hypothetical protein PKB14_17830 [Rubrivivax sp.]|nr:hypothetical protein [Rubrivivax sp.]
MNPPLTVRNEAPARVLALLVAANGSVGDQELSMLSSLDAFERLGVSRERFVELAQQCIDEVGAGLCERSWLRTTDLIYVNGLLDAVHDDSLRLLVCRLCAAAITADGRISSDERMVYDHTLAHWHIRQDQVSHAILHDRVH